jgi:DNA-binding LytR/AlgR family response regulator
MNIAVCEDNASDANLICGILKEHFDKNGFSGDIHTFKSGEELLKGFSPGLYDAVFLDIYMKGMTGIETASKMRAIDRDFALVFITTSDAHARDAYSVRACAYVSKPIRQSDMEIAFEQCRTIFLKSARYIEVKSRRQSIKIPLIKILYIEVFNKESMFHTTEGVVKTSMSLDEVECTMGHPFLRCHRSYLINMNHVELINEKDILMCNGDTIPMPQRGRTKVRDIYGNFITNRLFEVD